MSNQKYRPYFTAAEILELIAALKQSPTPRRLQLIRYLETFKIKIDAGVITAAHTLEPTIEQKLGLESMPPPQITEEAAYQKQLISPTKCTPHEIAAAMEYRYLNNLMSPEESRAYEQNLLGI